MMKHFTDVNPTGTVRERKTSVDTSVAFLLNYNHTNLILKFRR